MSSSWFPTTAGTRSRASPRSVDPLIIIAAMYLRGARLPGRGQLVERACRRSATPRLAEIALLAAACAVALIVLPYDFRQALVNSEIGDVMALSLVVITGFVGQISVVQLGLAGVSGFIDSDLAVGHGIPCPSRRWPPPWCSGW